MHVNSARQTIGSFYHLLHTAWINAKIVLHSMSALHCKDVSSTTMPASVTVIGATNVPAPYHPFRQFSAR